MYEKNGIINDDGSNTAFDFTGELKCIFRLCFSTVFSDIHFNISLRVSVCRVRLIKENPLLLRSFMEREALFNLKTNTSQSVLEFFR